MSAANQLPAAMTAAEFLAWNPQDSDRWELVDGTPRAMAPSTPRHGAIQAQAARLIGNHLVETRPACRLVTEAGVQPKVRANLNVRVPDLAITWRVEPRRWAAARAGCRGGNTVALGDIAPDIRPGFRLVRIDFSAPIEAFYRTAG